MRNYVLREWFKGKEHRKFKYPDDIDEELVPMLDVFNNIPGMRTQYCCCGHGGDGWYMVFEFTSEFMHEKTIQFFRGVCNSEDWRLGLEFEVFYRYGYSEISNIYGGVPEMEVSIYCNPLGKLPADERANKYEIICKYFSQFAVPAFWGEVQEF